MSFNVPDTLIPDPSNPLDFYRYGYADSNGDVYITGFFNSTADFDPGPGTFNLSGTRIFVSKLSKDGIFMWVKKFWWYKLL
jgi:hypothetical protein